MTNTVQELLLELRDAVEKFDKPTADLVCMRLVAASKEKGVEITPKQAKTALSDLRKKRCFDLLEVVATALGNAGRTEPVLRLQWVQAQIDQGKFEGAQPELDVLIEETDAGSFEWSEAWGLRGRLFKQRYIDEPGSDRERACWLEEAVRAYSTPYKHDSEQHYWHGINVVACVARGERDGLAQKSDLDWREEARQIRDRVSVHGPTDPDYTWAMATALEASVALGEPVGAYQWAERYIRAPFADAFELTATLRQLKEVWQLQRATPPERTILPILSGALGLRQGGILRVDSREEFESLSADPDDPQLEANFGEETTRSLGWMKRALKSCRAVARVLTGTLQHKGTGFLVSGKELYHGWGEEPVFVTNAHVIQDPPHERGVSPREARVRFTASSGPSDDEIEVDKVLWSSPAERFDTTVVRLRDLPEGVAPLYVCGRKDLDAGTSAPRLAVVGHPGGQDLQLSLYDNRLDGFPSDATSGGPQMVHYRSPTEEGSSGSPVFSESWHVLAIHHAALRAKGVNEGILLESMRSAISRDLGRPSTEAGAEGGGA